MKELTKFAIQILEDGKRHNSKSEKKPQIISPKRNEQKAWIELISRYEYDLFVTLTFREETKRCLAEKRFEKWLGSLNKELFGWRYRLKGLGIRYAVVYENQKRGTLHLHALLGAEGLKEENMKHLAKLKMEYWAKLWKCNGQRDKNGNLLRRIVNGHAVIDFYDPERGAIQYMTKHIFNGAEIDIFVPQNERVGKACSIETHT